MLDRYCRVRAALYRAVAEESGAKVIVDASKWPWDPVVLGLVPEVRPVAVHLVRDPRAVAHSWRRRKSWGDHEHGRDEMPRFGAGYSALSWLARNAATEWTHRKSRDVPWMLVRYEDFAARPRETLNAIAEHAGHPAEAPFVDEHTAHGAPDARRRGQSEQVLPRRCCHRSRRGMADSDVRPRPLGDDCRERAASLPVRLRVHRVRMSKAVSSSWRRRSPLSATTGRPQFVLDLSLGLQETFDVLIVAPRVPAGKREEEIDGLRIHRFAYFPRRWESLADGAMLPNLKARPSTALQVRSSSAPFCGRPSGPGGASGPPSSMRTGSCRAASSPSSSRSFSPCRMWSRSTAPTRSRCARAGCSG